MDRRSRSPLKFISRRLSFLSRVKQDRKQSDSIDRLHDAHSQIFPLSSSVPDLFDKHPNHKAATSPNITLYGKDNTEKPGCDTTSVTEQSLTWKEMRSSASTYNMPDANHRPTSASCFSRVTEPITYPCLSTPDLQHRRVDDGSDQSTPKDIRMMQKLFIETDKKYITKLTDYLYLGSVGAMYNEALLCRYNVDRIIDLTNTRVEDVPREMLNYAPCRCVNKPHCRPKLMLNIDSSMVDADDCFNEVNDFIEKARGRGSRVLIGSLKGNTNCTVVAIQYLIAHHQMNFTDAFRYIKCRRLSAVVTVEFRRLLKRWEKKQQHIQRGCHDVWDG